MAKRGAIYKALRAQGWQIEAYDIGEVLLWHEKQPTNHAILTRDFLAFEVEICKFDANGASEYIAMYKAIYSLDGINIAGCEISFTEPPKLAYAGPDGLFVPGA